MGPRYGPLVPSLRAPLTGISGSNVALLVMEILHHPIHPVLPELLGFFLKPGRIVIISSRMGPNTTGPFFLTACRRFQSQFRHC